MRYMDYGVDEEEPLDDLGAAKNDGDHRCLSLITKEVSHGLELDGVTTTDVP